MTTSNYLRTVVFGVLFTLECNRFYHSDLRYDDNFGLQGIYLYIYIYIYIYRYIYSGADKSLARPWKKTSYSDQDLQHYNETFGVQRTGIYSCCLYATSLGIVL